ncbi:PHA/PHB synthase family protein [Enemella sp. A6]|uniref:PHA/PHB synthase family protein n=1 Tax=Enemella sp. A6 TaxID=3440152 RepID=UPI003EB83F4A
MIKKLTRRASAAVDPFGWLSATMDVAKKAATNPVGVATATAKYGLQLATLPLSAAWVSTGMEGLPLPEVKGDKRWSNPAWTQHPMYNAWLRYWVATGEYVDDLIAAGGDPDEFNVRKARQFARIVLDMSAPCNNPFTNPDVHVRSWETGGKSLMKGFSHFLDDVIRRDGKPLRVDEGAFTVGENMAASKGKVIYRNELIEVMQYEPLTEKVHATPLLMVPPWINKYYIMDLNPGRSLVEWAGKQGRTVFMISYRNPDESMADTSFADYMTQGVLAALDVVQGVTEQDRIDLLCVCLGGAMATITAAYMSATGDDRIGNITLINTLLDYSETGDLGLMSDPETVYKIDTLMEAKGYLEGKNLATSFDLLRAHDLIYSYWITRWMLGEDPPAFDLLVWNEDSTNMPRKMHGEYLRSLYNNNELANGTLEMAGQRLGLDLVKNDVYIIGAINDHIVPWESSYAGVPLLGGDVRYVRASGGHIAGIVNPPSKKAWTEVLGDPTEASQMPATSAEWLAKAERKAISWWQDWAEWSKARAGELIDPPVMGGGKYEPMDDAPGTYVF